MAHVAYTVIGSYLILKFLGCFSPVVKHALTERRDNPATLKIPHRTPGDTDVINL